MFNKIKYKIKSLLIDSIMSFKFMYDDVNELIFKKKHKEELLRYDKIKDILNNIITLIFIKFL